MKKFITLCAVAAAAVATTALPANAAVFVGGFTLDSGSFGVQTGVHSTGTQSSATVTGYVNQDNSGVTFSTTSGVINITGSGEAVLDGDPLLENLKVVFDKAWNKITFSFEGNTGSFNLLVNNSALFSNAVAGNCVSLCTIGNGQNKFELTGTGITSLLFNFDTGIETARQFRVDVPTPTTPAVPEPATWAMMIGGLGLVGMRMRRRRIAFA